MVEQSLFKRVVHYTLQLIGAGSEGMIAQDENAIST